MRRELDKLQKELMDRPTSPDGKDPGYCVLPLIFCALQRGRMERMNRAKKEVWRLCSACVDPCLRMNVIQAEREEMQGLGKLPHALYGRGPWLDLHWHLRALAHFSSFDPVVRLLAGRTSLGVVKRRKDRMCAS